MMEFKKVPLDYESPKPTNEASSSDGTKAFVLSMLPPAFFCSLFVYQRAIFAEFWIIAVLLLSWISWLLSFGFAYFAWDEGGRQRALAMLALGISIGWPLILILALSQF